LRAFFVKERSLLNNIAKRNLKRDFLRRWWCKKYNLPPTDERFLRYTLPELIIEFYEDVIEEKGDANENEIQQFVEQMDMAKRYTEDGTVYYETGDEFIDTIEKLFVQGLKDINLKFDDKKAN